MENCQCEHANHFEDDEQARTRHAYGLPLTAADEPERVKTERGTFTLCDTCRGEHHMAPYAV